MSDELPQPERPPRRAIPAGTGIWQPRDSDGDESAAAEPGADQTGVDFAPGSTVLDEPAEHVRPPVEDVSPQVEDVTFVAEQTPGAGLGTPEWRTRPQGEPGSAAHDGQADGGIPPAAPSPLRSVRSPENAGPPSQQVRADSAAAYAETMKIGIWGSPGSGKTTYLASLKHALRNADRSIGRWSLYPRTKASEKLLTEWTQQLVGEHVFPEATALGAVVPLRWRFIGDLTGSRYMPRRGLRRRAPASSEFDLEAIDVSGEVFGYDPNKKNVKVDVIQETLDHLAAADGLIFLFDPITERDRSTIVSYVDRILTQLSARILDEGRTVGPYLPHYISVCITKVDHPELYRQARRAGLVNTGPDGIPRILDAQAKELFDTICEGRFWAERDERNYAGAIFVRDQLSTYFHPDRIRYYATSAIGYHKAHSWDPAVAERPGVPFNPKTLRNVNNQDHTQKILGPIQPINVLEPLIELHMQLRGRA